MAQTGNVIVIETPFDKEIAEETAKLNATVIMYGDASQQEAVDGKLRLQKGMSFARNAARALFNNKAEGRAVQGRGDLLFDAREDKSLLERTDELPEELQKMTVEEREKFVKEKQAERDAINKKIGELSAKRTEWLKTEGEKKRLEAVAATRPMADTPLARPTSPAAPAVDAEPSFDRSVSEIIQRQSSKVAGE